MSLSANVGNFSSTSEIYAVIAVADFVIKFGKKIFFRLNLFSNGGDYSENFFIVHELTS